MATSPSSLPVSPFSPSPSSSPSSSQPASSMLNPLAPPFTFPPPPPPPPPACCYVYTPPRVPACCYIQATGVLSPSCYVSSPYYTTYIVYSTPPSFQHIMSPPSLKPFDHAVMLPSPEVPAAPEELKKSTTQMTFPLRRRYPSSTPSKPKAMKLLQRTTVMIRNIPNKLSREMLIELLDKHCAEQNERSSVSAYDFVYLPIDFKKRRNLGYAFVNFTEPEAARRLFDCMHGYRWNIFGSNKVTQVCNARIQGRIAMLNRFKDSYFVCDTDDYLPVIFSPARDGAASRPAPAVIGRRLPDRL